MRSLISFIVMMSESRGMGVKESEATNACIWWFAFARLVCMPCGIRGVEMMACDNIVASAPYVAVARVCVRREARDLFVLEYCDAKYNLSVGRWCAVWD